ncbi:MAG: YlxR family protein [Deltaproteobacteria bacterium]|nr:YlxR family protein [Deltaproteobacteria bacterium]
MTGVNKATTPAAPPADPATNKSAGKKKRGTKKGRRRVALGHDEPFRMCIVCRASKVPAELLRFARSVDGAVGFDVAARLPGRGAWVCAQKACLEKASDPKHGGFARAFDAAVVFEPAVLRDQVRALLDADLLARLGLLRRQGQLILGRDDVARRLINLAFVGLSTDLSDNSRHEVKETLKDLEQVAFPAMAVVGEALGVRPVGVVGVLKGHGVEGLKASLARAAGVVA